MTNEKPNTGFIMDVVSESEKAIDRYVMSVARSRKQFDEMGAGEGTKFIASICEAPGLCIVFALAPVGGIVRAIRKRIGRTKES